MSDMHTEAMQEPEDWLGKKLLDENSLTYRTVWDLYLKFYTVYLTFSVVALGVTIQYVSHKNRWPLVLIFVGHNLVAGFTAVLVGRFSIRSAKRYEDLCKLYIESDSQHKKLESLSSSPFPGWLGKYASYACIANHILLIICWIVVLSI